MRPILGRIAGVAVFVFIGVIAVPSAAAEGSPNTCVALDGESVACVITDGCVGAFVPPAGVYCVNAGVLCTGFCFYFELNGWRMIHVEEGTSWMQGYLVCAMTFATGTTCVDDSPFSQ